MDESNVLPIDVRVLLFVSTLSIVIGYSLEYRRTHSIQKGGEKKKRSAGYVEHSKIAIYGLIKLFMCIAIILIYIYI